jgi:hypothetical protein
VSPGLSFRETMSGTYWRLDEPTEERAIAVAIEGQASLRGLVRDKIWSLHGTLDAEGLATGCAVEGTLAFRLLDERRLPYRLAFTGDDGRRYELSGQKEWSGVSPIESMTLLPASLYGSDGEELARATLRFDLRMDLAPWLKSFRLRLFS